MKLSIITITYNAEKVVNKTIESVLRQTKTIYEYVFVDGGSTDSTNDVIKSYYSALDRQGIKVTHISEKDRGISDAFNKGIKLATGDLIGIINADDELLPSSNELLSEHYEKDPDCNIIYGNCLWVDEVNNLQIIKKPCHDLDRLYYDLVLIHPATFIKKSAYKKYGMYNIDYRYCMDKELLCRMHVQGAKFSYIDNEIALMRAGGISDRNAFKTIKEGVKLSNSYHCPKYITYMKAVKKICKHKASSIAKKTPIYVWIKKGSKKLG